MAYGFNFDLSRMSKDFFTALAKMSHRRRLPKRIGDQMRNIIDHSKISDLTGLNVKDALTVVEDLVEVYTKNLSSRDQFNQTRNRALFLPHCARKYMDGRCKAAFDDSIASYTCAQCSTDCLVNKSSLLAKARGYAVHILPGGSCIMKVMDQGKYEGVVGVACCQELKIGMSELERRGIESQGIPLIKNGCAGTAFNLESLSTTL